MERQGLRIGVPAKALGAVGALVLPVVAISDGNMADAIEPSAIDVGEDAAAVGEDVLRDVIIKADGVVGVEGGHDAPVGELDGVLVVLQPANDTAGLSTSE